MAHTQIIDGWRNSLLYYINLYYFNGLSVFPAFKIQYFSDYLTLVFGNVARGVTHRNVLEYLYIYRLFTVGCYETFRVLNLTYENLLESFMHSQFFDTIFGKAERVSRGFSEFSTPKNVYDSFLLFGAYYMSCQPGIFLKIIHAFWYILSAIYHRMFRKRVRRITSRNFFTTIRAF